MMMVKTSLKKFSMIVKTSLKKFLMMVKTIFLKLSSDKISGLKRFVEKKERSFLVIIEPLIVKVRGRVCESSCPFF